MTSQVESSVYRYIAIETNCRIKGSAPFRRRVACVVIHDLRSNDQ
jgi:hypothetical protein